MRSLNICIDEEWGAPSFFEVYIFDKQERREEKSYGVCSLSTVLLDMTMDGRKRKNYIDQQNKEASVPEHLFTLFLRPTPDRG